jgi:hypothetical protein
MPPMSCVEGVTSASLVSGSRARACLPRARVILPGVGSRRHATLRVVHCNTPALDSGAIVAGPVHHNVPSTSFIDAPRPCDTCRQVARCAADLRACNQFVLFSNGASAKRPEPRAASRISRHLRGIVLCEVSDPVYAAMPDPTLDQMSGLPPSGPSISAKADGQ